MAKVTEEEFLALAKTMVDIPKKADETQEDYFDRIEPYLPKQTDEKPRSRYTLQKVLHAIESDPEHPLETYQFFLSIEQNRAEQRKLRKAKKKVTVQKEEQLPGQMEMELPKEQKPAEQPKGNDDKMLVELDRIAEQLTQISKAMWAMVKGGGSK